MAETAESRLDRLYELLPLCDRQRDLERHGILKDLLRIISEEVDAIQDDITATYDNWFIETCEPWVVSYIGDLVGYRALDGGALDGTGPDARRLDRAMWPRRFVANFIRDLRRRGTLSLLENLSAEVAGLPCRAVEFYRLLGRTQSLNHLNHRGALLDLRNGETLDLLGTAFERAAHTVDVRTIDAAEMPGWFNIPSVGAFVWRLRAYPSTRVRPYFFQERGIPYACFTFSALGNDAPLFTRPVPEPDTTSIAGEINVPTPIRRRALERHPERYYGPELSFAIWSGGEPKPIPVERIVAADLTDWKYRPKGEQVAVDPELGRMMTAKKLSDVRVSFHYGFPAEVGAHQSARAIDQTAGAKFYRVGQQEQFQTVAAALAAWQGEAPPAAVIEVTDNETYTEQIPAIEIPERASLELRAANRCRPTLRVLDYDPASAEGLTVVAHDGARFLLDGILLVGRPLRVSGTEGNTPSVRVKVRRSTLVPGWGLGSDCTPTAPGRPSIEMTNVRGSLCIEQSILGPLSLVSRVDQADPLRVTLADSIVDAGAADGLAIAGAEEGYAWASVKIVRCTVIGEVLAHALRLAGNSILNGTVRIVRRQEGCVRFCWLPPGSRTPRRYHCQPDLVLQSVPPERAEEETRRVRPEFTSSRFGRPAYCQLASGCPDEISRGADDESEMGAYHDLFVPQKEANLRTRLEQSTPAGMTVAIIHAD